MLDQNFDIHTGDGSTGYGNVDNSQTNKHDQQMVAGAGGNAIGMGSSAVTLQGGEGSTFNVSQESPQALLALQVGTQTALDRIASTAMGSLNFAQRVNKDALDLVEKNSESPLQQSGRILIPLAFIIGAVIILYLRRK